MPSDGGNAFSLCRIRAGDYSGTGKSRDPQAKAEGRQIGRPQTAAKKEKEVRRLFAKGLSKAEIARRVGIGRTSVRRLLA